MRLLLLLDLTLRLRLTPTMAIGADTTDPTMAMAGDTGARKRGQLMRILKLLVLTPMPKLMLMASTPMDMAMFTPTDMDTTLARGLLMKLLFLDLMLMLRLIPTTAIGVDTTDPTMAMAGDTGARRKGQLMLSLRLRPILTLMLTLMLGGAITDTPMAAIMAMVTIPMDTTGAESNQQYKFTKKDQDFSTIRDRFLNI